MIARFYFKAHEYFFIKAYSKMRTTPRFYPTGRLTTPNIEVFKIITEQLSAFICSGFCIYVFEIFCHFFLFDLQGLQLGNRKHGKLID